MKRGYFIVLAFVAFAQNSWAQTTKADVLVIGNGNNSIGAGIQSAVSGAKTVILLMGQNFELSPLNWNLSSGIEAEFLNRMKTFTGVNDGTTRSGYDDEQANAVLKIWTDSLKNLTVIRNSSWIKLKRSGRGWSMELVGGKTIKAEVLVNADKTGKLDAALQLMPVSVSWKPFNYEDKSYRTSLASGYFMNKTSANVLPLSQLLNPLQENLVALDPDYQSMAAGQAAGATAAGAGFFNLNTSESNLKKIQGELIYYKQALVPFSDVDLADSSWRAIQFIGLSGFLKAEILDGTAYFRPDKNVSAEEIKEVIKEHYNKAQIWFEDYRQPTMTISSTLNMICYVGSKVRANTEAEIKKNWQKVYHFKTEFDPSRNITRREFAVLLNGYLNPFNVNIDGTGRVMR